MDKLNVNIWSRIFDLEYSKMRQDDFVFNTNVWRKFSTNEFFSVEEMKEWTENTYSKLNWLSGNKVLEIGCGNGLISKFFSGKSIEYIGIDTSESAIRKLGEYFEKSLNMNFYVSDANSFNPQIKKFDIIVINSVIQYYPGLDYLFESIRLAISWLSNTGIIFIGDVRSLPHSWFFERQKIFSKEVINSKSDSKFYAVEKETLYHPNLFKMLPNIFTDIKHSVIDLKRGSLINELSRYRYDVFLFKGDYTKNLPLNDLIYKDKIFINNRLLTVREMKRMLKENIFEDGTKYLIEPFDGSKFIDFSLDRGLCYFKINQFETLDLNESSFIDFTNKKI